MKNEESESQPLYGWELDLAQTVTHQIFSIILNKIFLFQPANPQEYCYHLLSAWDGESVYLLKN